VRRVRVREQQAQLALAQLPFERVLLDLDLRGELVVLGRELRQLDEVVRLPLEPLPGLELVAKLARLARQRAGRRRVIPDTGLRELLVEPLRADPLGGEVKDAPSARGCA
jgi:hypothetical protein